MLVRRAGGDWQPPKVGSYANEAELQQLVSDSPHLVGATVPAVALRELPLRDAGNLDVLLIDIGGGLTLVEAKLNRNAEIRRAVVGQLLGYAGGLWGMAYDDLDAAVQSRHGASLMEGGRGVDRGAPSDARPSGRHRARRPGVAQPRPRIGRCSACRTPNVRCGLTRSVSGQVRESELDEGRHPVRHGVLRVRQQVSQRGLQHSQRAPLRLQVPRPGTRRDGACTSPGPARRRRPVGPRPPDPFDGSEVEAT
jgi:hypothetical protein